MFKKLISAIFALTLLPMAALAQTAPGVVKGQVWTAAQWNAYFATKMDYTGFAPFSSAGGHFLGEIWTFQSSAGGAGLNINCGTAPTVPHDGDVWCTTAGVYARISGATVGPMADHSYVTTALSSYLPLAGGTLSGELVTEASATAHAGLNIPQGTAPTAPVNGDVWTTTAGVYARINGATVGPMVDTSAIGAYLPLAGGTLSGKETTVATATGGAGLNLPHGTAPSAPVNGDIWTTTSGVYARINGATIGPMVDSTFTSAYLPLTGGTLSGDLVTLASATGGAGFNLPPGAAPSAPVNGDIWTTSAGMYARINGTTVGPMAAGGGGGNDVLLGTWTQTTAGSYSYTAPSGTPAFYVITSCGSGGGGQGGGFLQFGIAQPGSPGSGGFCRIVVIDAAAMTAALPVSVTVGAGVSGGAGATVAGQGTAGANGNPTLFGSLFAVPNGFGGGQTGNGYSNSADYFQCVGGGHGAWFASATPYAGLYGGTPTGTSHALAGVSTGDPGANATIPGGGGGGGALGSATTNGGAGGNGLTCGGGGGGGAFDGTGAQAGGLGGSSGDGYIIVQAYGTP